MAAIFIAAKLGTQSAHEGTVLVPLLVLLGIMLASGAVVGRLWCALFISGRKHAQLVTTGPYSISRHPLYFFSFVGFAGVGLATGTLTLAVLLVGAFVLAYGPAIAAEERALRLRFGAAFDDYRACTPRLLPRPSRLTEPERYEVDPRAFRRMAGGAIWFVWLAAIVGFLTALDGLQLTGGPLRLP